MKMIELLLVEDAENRSSFDTTKRLRKVAVTEACGSGEHGKK